MGRTACTEPQCLYKCVLYLNLCKISGFRRGLNDMLALLARTHLVSDIPVQLILPIFQDQSGEEVGN
jgi:hypothetical protein